MRPRLVSLLIAGALIAPVAPLAAPPSDAFVVALVRDDGVMLPVAVHDRGRWRTPWPGPAKEAEVPVRVEDCPLAWWGLAAPPSEWVLLVPGESPRLVTAERTTWVQTYCRQQVVLHSRAATRPVMRWPEGGRAPKYGVAVAGPGQVTLPRPVAPESDEGRALMDHVQQTFNREERLMFAEDYFAVYQPSVGPDDRDRLPVRALSIHSGMGRTGEATYFVELTRGYPRRGPEHLRWCDEVTYMSGWVRRGGDDALDLTLVTRAVTSCLLDTTQRADPQAIMHTPRGPVWMLNLYRPDAEVVGLFLAPDGDDPEPLAMRDLGRCVGGAVPRGAPPRSSADDGVPWTPPSSRTPPAR